MECLKAKTFTIVSPEYCTYESNGIDPPEYGCDVVDIETDSKKDAIALALKTKEFEGWIQEAKDNEISPYSGVKAMQMDCEEGFCCCPNCKNYCKYCREEL